MLILDRLKEQNGPFTCVEEIDEYLQSKLSDKEKQQRLRDDVTYARDTSCQFLVLPLSLRSITQQLLLGVCLQQYNLVTI